MSIFGFSRLSLTCVISLLMCVSVPAQDSGHTVRRTVPPEPAKIPNGSYQKTCADIKMSDGLLQAKCQNLKDHWYKTELQDPNRCVGDIENINGRLSCVPSPSGAVSASAGDWEESIGQYQHNSWAEEQGAPSQIWAITQTMDGYLWLGTAAGLYYFDGVRFTQFVPPAGEEFPGNRVVNFLASRDGSLWMMFNTGAVSRLRNGHVSSYSAREGLPFTYALAESEDGSLIAGTERGLARFTDGRWTDVSGELHFPGKQAKQVYFDREGALWVLTEDRVVYLPAGQNEFVDPGENAGLVLNFAEAPDGTIWISEPGRSAHAVGRSANHAVTEVRVGASCVLFDRNGGLWIASVGDGLRRIAHPERISGRSIAQFGPEAEQFTTKDGLSADYVLTLFEDREGNIWSGSTNGLDRFRKSAFTPVPIPHPDVPRGIFATKDGGLWIFASNPVGPLRIGPQGDMQSFGDAGISSMFEDEHGAVWFGCCDARLFQVQSGRLAKVFESEHLPSEGSPKAVIGITGDREGGIWMLDETGLFRLASGALTKIAERVNPLVRGYLYTDRSDRIWVADFDHLTVYDRGTVQTIGTSDGIPGGRIFTIYQDRAGNIWFGGDGGLNKLENGRFRPLSKSNGLPAKSVIGLTEDNEGDWWILVDSGVLRVPAGELDHAIADSTYRIHYRSFNVLDGLHGKPRMVTPLQAVARTADGRIWFATTKGIAVVNPRRIPQNPLPPPVIVEAIRVDGKQIVPGNGLAFPQSANDIQIDYTALSLSIPERVLFRYKLEGSDTDWHEAGTRRQAFYSHLAPKRYRFRVIACNNDGVWNETGATLDFSVAPAFYQTAWFESLLVLAILGCIYLGYRLRVQQLSRQLRVRMYERLAERTRIAQELHDTLLQSFQGLMLRFQGANEILLSNPSEAKEALEGALDRADQALTESRRAIQGIRTDQFSDRDLEHALRAILNDVVADELLTKGKRPTTSVLAEGKPRNVYPGVGEEICKIAREAFRNAITHGQAQHIESEIAFSKGFLRVRFRDDGVGIDAVVLKEGVREGHWGLTGMKERARRLRGHLKMWSKPGTGTEVELTVPAYVAFESGHSWVPFKKTDGETRSTHDERA